MAQIRAIIIVEMKILTISGSLKARSSNGAILRAAEELTPGSPTITRFEQQLAAIPAFNPDADGLPDAAPPAVAELRASLAAADALIVSSPEYAHGVPGALKNAFDWIVSSGELTDKPILILVASASGGTFARACWRETFTVMGGRVIGDEAIVVPRGGWDAAGQLTDEPTRARLSAACARLVAAAAPQ